MARPKLLDLFCKGGGASAGYHAAGFDVTGADIEPQPDYPFDFIQTDALTIDLAGYDVIAASPPCQLFSSATPIEIREGYPDLLTPIRERLRKALAAPGGPWAYVIENVPGAPLIDPIMICGDTLRLGVRRHRLFESNFPLRGTPCWHDRPERPVAVYGTYGQRIRRAEREDETHSTDDARSAMGIDWLPWPALTQAIPPAFTHWLGVQLLTSDATPELCDFVTRDISTPAGNVTENAGAIRNETLSTGFRHCRCGNPLPPRPATGRWPRYCSQACRQAAYRARLDGSE